MDFRAIDGLAASQRGLVTNDQLRRAGLSSRQIELALGRADLRQMCRGVYRLPGVAVTWEHRVRAATMSSPDTLGSHRAAVRWWGVDRFPVDTVDVVTERSARRRLDGVIAHQTFDLPAADRAIRDGLPVTSIERSLIDVGRYRRATAVGAMLDLAVRHGMTTYERFERRVHELARPGRNGIGVARLVLADRGFGDGWGFEKRMRGLLRSEGFPLPAREFRVHTAGRRFRVDFAFPDSMVGIECDSSEWHTLPFQHDHDLERQNLILREGLLLLRYTLRRLREEPAGVAAEIRETLTSRRGWAGVAAWRRGPLRAERQSTRPSLS